MKHKLNTGDKLLITKQIADAKRVSQYDNPIDQHIGRTVTVEFVTSVGVYYMINDRFEPWWGGSGTALEIKSVDPYLVPKKRINYRDLLKKR